MKMINLLDQQLASKRTATRISVLTAMYSKSFSPKENMVQYINEFERISSQLERMDDEKGIPEAHKAPILFPRMGNSSPLESVGTAVHTKDTDQLSWEPVSANLIFGMVATENSQQL